MCITRQWSYMCQLRREGADKLLSQVIPLIPQNQWHLGKMGTTALSCSYETSQPPAAGNPTQFKSWPPLVAAKQMEGLVLRKQHLSHPWGLHLRQWGNENLSNSSVGV